MYHSRLIPGILFVALSLGAAEIAAREGGGHGGFRGGDFQSREEQLLRGGEGRDNLQYREGLGYPYPYYPSYTYYPFPVYKQDIEAQEKFDAEFPVDDY